MRKFRFLVIPMIIGLLLCSGLPVYADDGLDVDIAVVGDDADVGVDIHGDNADVCINGQDLCEPTVISNTIVQSGGGGPSGYWIKEKIADAVNPLYDWAVGAEPRLQLTMDGLANLIADAKAQRLEMGSTRVKFYDLSNGVEGYRQQVEEMDSNLKALQGSHMELETQTQELIREVVAMRQDYNNKMVLLAGAIILLTLENIIWLAYITRRKRG